LCVKEVIFRHIKDSIIKTEVTKAFVNSLPYLEFRKLISDKILLKENQPARSYPKTATSFFHFEWNSNESFG